MKQLRALAALGWGMKRIARELGVARNSIRRYLREGVAAETQSRPGAWTLDAQLSRGGCGVRVKGGQTDRVIEPHEVAAIGVIEPHEVAAIGVFEFSARGGRTGHHAARPWPFERLRFAGGGFRKVSPSISMT